MHSELGNRMKGNYEDRNRPYLTRRTPVIIRVDGRAFHTITKKADKPFDTRIIEAMLEAAMKTAQEMQGFKAGFVQSDEASFLLMDDDTNTTEAWFDYNQQKLVSISAALTPLWRHPGLPDLPEELTLRLLEVLARTLSGFLRDTAPPPLPHPTSRRDARATAPGAPPAARFRPSAPDTRPVRHRPPGQAGCCAMPRSGRSVL